MPFLVYFLVFSLCTRKLPQDDSFGASNAGYELPRAQFILFAIYISSNSWQYLEINLVNGSLQYGDCIHHLKKDYFDKIENVPANQTFSLIFYLDLLYLANNKITFGSIRILPKDQLVPTSSTRIGTIPLVVPSWYVLLVDSKCVRWALWNNLILDIESSDLIFTLMDIMMNILHAIHELWIGSQETSFISEATDFAKKISFIV